MANWTILKEAIASVIKTNDNQEITGQLLQNALNNIITNVGENATFAGIATPTTNPGTPDGPVFYIATTAGSYSNFGSLEVSKGETAILQWNNGTWTKNAIKPMAEFESGIIYDVSANNDGAVFESLSTLLGSANLSTLIPTSVRRGGMSILFIQGSVPNSDNKYVQYRLMSDTFNTTVANWQGVDNEPTAGSDNLVKSGGVAIEVCKANANLLDLQVDGVEYKQSLASAGDFFTKIGLKAGRSYNITTSSTLAYALFLGDYNTNTYDTIIASLRVDNPKINYIPEFDGFIYGWANDVTANLKVVCNDTIENESIRINTVGKLFSDSMFSKSIQIEKNVAKDISTGYVIPSGASVKITVTANKDITLPGLNLTARNQSDITDSITIDSLNNKYLCGTIVSFTNTSDIDRVLYVYYNGNMTDELIICISANQIKYSEGNEILKAKYNLYTGIDSGRFTIDTYLLSIGKSYKIKIIPKDKITGYFNIGLANTATQIFSMPEGVSVERPVECSFVSYHNDATIIVYTAESQVSGQRFDIELYEISDNVINDVSSIVSHTSKYLAVIEAGHKYRFVASKGSGYMTITGVVNDGQDDPSRLFWIMNQSRNEIEFYSLYSIPVSVGWNGGTSGDIRTYCLYDVTGDDNSDATKNNVLTQNLVNSEVVSSLSLDYAYISSAKIDKGVIYYMYAAASHGQHTEDYIYGSQVLGIYNTLSKEKDYLLVAKSIAEGGNMVEGVQTYYAFNGSMAKNGNILYLQIASTFTLEEGNRNAVLWGREYDIDNNTLSDGYFLTLDGERFTALRAAEICYNEYGGSPSYNVETISYDIHGIDYHDGYFYSYVATYTTNNENNSIMLIKSQNGRDWLSVGAFSTHKSWSEFDIKVIGDYAYVIGRSDADTAISIGRMNITDTSDKIEPQICKWFIGVTTPAFTMYQGQLLAVCTPVYIGKGVAYTNYNQQGVAICYVDKETCTASLICQGFTPANAHPVYLLNDHNNLYAAFTGDKRHLWDSSISETDVQVSVITNDIFQ